MLYVSQNHCNSSYEVSIGADARRLVTTVQFAEQQFHRHGAGRTSPRRRFQGPDKPPR